MNVTHFFLLNVLLVIPPTAPRLIQSDVLRQLKGTKCYTSTQAEQCWKLSSYDPKVCGGNDLKTCWDTSTDWWYTCSDFQSCGACCDATCNDCKNSSTSGANSNVGGGGDISWLVWIIIYLLLSCLIAGCVGITLKKRYDQQIEEEYEKHLSKSDPLKYERQRYKETIEASKYTNTIEYCQFCNENTNWLQFSQGFNLIMTYEIVHITPCKPLNDGSMVSIREIYFRNSVPDLPLKKGDVIIYNNEYVKMCSEPRKSKNSQPDIWTVDVEASSTITTLQTNYAVVNNHFSYQANIFPKIHCCHKDRHGCCPSPPRLPSGFSVIRKPEDRGVTAEWLRKFTYESPRPGDQSITEEEKRAHVDSIRDKCTKVVQLVILEKTRAYGCRYTELPGVRNHVGRANFFVSHAWNGGATKPHFQEENRFWEKLVLAVSAHSEKLQKANPGFVPKYFVDVLAVNQHRENRKFGPEMLNSLISSLDGTLLILASDDISHPDTFHPVAPTRAWCLKEFFVTDQFQKKLDIELAPEDELAFQRQLLYEGGSNTFENNVIENIDVEKSESSNPLVTEKIKKSVQASEGGFKKLNGVVKDGFRKWLVTAGEKALRRLGNDFTTVNNKDVVYREKTMQAYINSIHDENEKKMLHCISKNKYIGEVTVIFGNILSFLLTVACVSTSNTDEWAPIVFFKVLTFLMLFNTPIILAYQEIRKRQRNYLVGAVGGQFAAKTATRLTNVASNTGNSSSPGGSGGSRGGVSCWKLILFRSSGGVCFFLWLVLAGFTMYYLKKEFEIYSLASMASHRFNSNCICKQSWIEEGCNNSQPVYGGCTNACAHARGETSDIHICWVNLTKDCDVGKGFRSTDDDKANSDWMYCDDHSSKKKTGTFPLSYASGWAVLSASLVVQILLFLLFIQEGVLTDFKRDAISYVVLQRDIGLMYLHLKRYTEALLCFKKSSTFMNSISTSLWYKHGIQGLLHVELQATRQLVNNSGDPPQNMAKVALEYETKRLGCCRSLMNRFFYTEHGLTAAQWEREKYFIAAVARACSSTVNEQSKLDVNRLLSKALSAGFDEPNAQKHPFLARYAWPNDDFTEEVLNPAHNLGEEVKRSSNDEISALPRSRIRRRPKRRKSVCMLFTHWFQENNGGLRTTIFLSAVFFFMWYSVVQYSNYGFICGFILGFWSLFLVTVISFALFWTGSFKRLICFESKKMKHMRTLLAKENRFNWCNLSRYFVALGLAIFISWFSNPSMDPKSNQYCKKWPF
jgi:hypothetical protein